MKTILLSPNYELVFTAEQKHFLENQGVVVYTKPGPLSGVKEFQDPEEKILMIDPDYCEWNLKEADLAAISNLVCVLVQTTSFSWLPVKFLAEKGVPVCNIKGFSAPAVADFLLMGTLSLARRLPLIMKNDWKEDFSENFLGFELEGKRAGIIGIGNVGSQIAKRCLGLGMDVCYWSRSNRDEAYTYIELDELLRTSDVIYPCFALNDETRQLLNEEALKTLKKSALLVSPLGDEAFDVSFVRKLVEDGELSGLFYESRAAEKNQDITGNTLIAPDHAWLTQESMHRNGTGWLENLELAQKGEYKSRVN